MCGVEIHDGFQELMGMDAWFLVCQPCDAVFLTKSKDDWKLEQQDATMPLLQVVRVLPSHPKVWSDGTELLASLLPDDVYSKASSSQAVATLKTPQMHLSPNWALAVDGPLRFSHFQHGTVFLQLTTGSWVEVGLSDRRTDLCIAARPATPGHGVIFKCATKSDAAPGTQVAIGCHNWNDFAYEQSSWVQCTNCCSIFSMFHDNCLEGCYSSHMLLTCHGCCAIMLFDIPGEDAPERDPACAAVLLDSQDHMFLPAKEVASVGPASWEEDGTQKTNVEGLMPCASCIVNLPREPYPPGTDLSHDGSTILVLFADGTWGDYSGD
jgi:hypothetical protein